MLSAIPILALVLAALSPTAGAQPLNTISALSKAIDIGGPLPLRYDIVADVTYVSTNIADENILRALIVIT